MEKNYSAIAFRIPKIFLKFIFFLLLLFFSPCIGDAADLDLEKGLRNDLEQSETVVEKISTKLKSGSLTATEINQLKSLAENVKASHLLMQERFKLREEKVKTLGSKAIERQRAMSAGYSEALTEYLSLMDGLSPESSSKKSGVRSQQATIDKIKTLLDKIIPKKKRPIFGSLPYKHLNYTAKEPSTAPSITPAYRGGNQNSTGDDLKSTAEAPITTEIATLAQSLNWNPVLIYEYVKNNVETEWYWGCMKGAEETLHQKSGNDCDQAALLTALLRASNYPTRYVRGTIEFFPDIERAKNLIGIDDPQKIAEFFQKAGIPFKTVLDGTTIKNIQIEHIWVESLIPYSNYRGAIMDDQGKTWLGLDTSIKAAGYTYNTPSDILSEYSLATIRDDYLSATQTQTPLEYLQTKINDYLAQNHPEKTYADYLSTKTLVPEVMQILPGSMQFSQVKITNEYTQIPDELIHTVKFTATDPANTELFTITLNALKLSNRKIIMSYEPDTVDDQEIINNFGSLDNTPAYLVHLRPTLLIDDEQIITASGGVAMGGDYNFTVTVTSPYGAETFTNTMISGNMTAIGIVSQRSVVPAAIDQTKAANLLYREALRYIDNWNKGEDELASLLRVAAIRPIPNMVTLGNTIDVTYLLDQPNGFEWKGVYLDADLRAIETVQSAEFGVGSERQKNFMQLTGLHGSVLENKVFEDAFQVGSISTAKLFGVANSGLPATPILAIDQTNINTILPTLTFDQNIKDDISASVAEGLTVRIPQSEIAYEDWTGIGYIKENPATGEAGYMLSGRVAGGMTAWGVIRWIDLWLSILSVPFSGMPNTDPTAAVYIEKISGTDLQEGQLVNTDTTHSLQVIVRDIEKKPVQGALVTFTVKAGEGSLIDTTGAFFERLSVQTNYQGIAWVPLKLGMLTSANPDYIQRPGDTYPMIVGINIVDAELASGPFAGTKVNQPFTIPAFPDVPARITKLNDTGTGNILGLYGTVSVYVMDHYGNPVANIPVDFLSKYPYLLSSTTYCVVDEDSKKAQLTQDDTCLYNRTGWGECANSSYSLQGIKTLSDGSVTVGVMLGDLPFARYMVDATYAYNGTGETATFALYTPIFGNCDPGDPPLDAVIVSYFNEVDSYGSNIDARPALIPSPLRAKAYVLTAADGVLTVSYPSDLSVIFNNQTGLPVQGLNGTYEAKYPLPTGLNNIKVTASSGQNKSSVTADVYGVLIKMPQGQVTARIDQNGYAVQDIPITYTIQPSGTEPAGQPAYTAASAQFLIYKNNNLSVVIQTEKTGSPTATIARGFHFDKASTYEVQVLLNYGYQSSVIWSERKTLTVTDTWARITNVDTPCDNHITQNPCVDSFVALRPVNNVRPGDSITVLSEAKNGAIDISDQITWICEDVPDDGIASGTCTISTASPGPTITFIPNPPAADTGRTKPLAYQVKAQITVEGKTYEDIKIIKQDNLDELRQEYEDLPERVSRTRGQFDNEVTPTAYPRLLDQPDIENGRHAWHILKNTNLSQNASGTDDLYSGTLKVTCGFRCPIANELLYRPDGTGSSRSSRHQYGNAFDFNQNPLPRTLAGSTENYNAYHAALNAGADRRHSYLQTSSGTRYFEDTNAPPLPGDLPQDVTYVLGHTQWP